MAIQFVKLNVTGARGPVGPTGPTGGSGNSVASKSAMKAIDANNGDTWLLGASGIYGTFTWRTGDYSAQVASDPREGLYIVSTVSGKGATVGCWVRQWDGFHVRPQWFGAAGDGSTDDAGPIQAAIDAAEFFAGSTKGARLVLSDLDFRINSGLRVKKDRIEIEFTGGARLIPHGSFDTLTFQSASAATFIYFNKLINGLFDETNKTGGKALVGKYLAESEFKLTTAGGFDGIQLDTFNTIDLDARITNLTSSSAIYCLARGGGSVGARSDVLRINKMVMGGNYVAGQKGLVLDGFVHTVVGKSVYAVNVGGRALETRNTIGASDNPTFLNFWDFETDFQRDEGIYLGEGRVAEFQGAIVNGSRASDNIFVGSLFKDARFMGGRSTGAARSGVAIAGADAVVMGMKCMSNSSDEFTGTRNTLPGILVGGTSSGTRILGCRSGDPSTSTYQSYGIQIDTGAANFVVKDNDVRSNVGSGVNNGAGTSSSKIVSDNIP